MIGCSIAAETGGRWRSVVEILILQALAENERWRGAAGLDSLVGALTLAEPEGYVRSFVGEGAPMADMLTLAAKRGITPEYVRACSALSDAVTVFRPRSEPGGAAQRAGA